MGRTIIVLLLTFVVSVYSPQLAFAANYSVYPGTVTNPTLTLIGGVGDYGSHDRYYYVTSSAVGITDKIKSAVDSWVYTTQRLSITTPISIKRTTVQSQSVFDVYITDQLSSQSAKGETYFYNGSTRLNNNSNEFPYNDWTWAKILISPSFISDSTFTESQKTGTIAHEFGHAMGLGHSSYNFTIMCTIGTRIVQQPQSDDLAGINYLY